MKASAVVVALVAVALAAAFAWARPGRNTRDLVRPRIAPIANAAGKVTYRLTGSGRAVEFRLSGLERRKRYAVRFNQDEHPVLRATRTDRRGRARFKFAGIHLPFGILEPISNRPIEVVTFDDAVPGEQILVGRIPIVDGFPYWGQPATSSGGSASARLAGVDGNGPFAVEAATAVIPTSPSTLAPGNAVIWYPGSGGTVTAGGTYPPVVFAHAARFGAADYQNWGQKIASWGFVVALLDYADPATAADGQEEVRATLAAMNWLVAQNADASSRFHGRLDVVRFGFVGHGRGAAASVIAAAHSASQGRVKAVAALAPEVLRIQSGIFGEYMPYAPDAGSGLWPPTIVLTGTQDGLVNPSESRAAYFDAAPKPRGTVQVEGHCNANYADRVPPAVAPTSDYDPNTCEPPASQQQVSRTYVVPWLLHHLKNDPRVLDYINGSYAAEQVNVVEESFD